jgi:hypothetical protein
VNVAKRQDFDKTRRPPRLARRLVTPKYSLTYRTDRGPIYALFGIRVVNFGPTLPAAHLPQLASVCIPPIVISSHNTSCRCYTHYCKRPACDFSGRPADTRGIICSRLRQQQYRADSAAPFNVAVRHRRFPQRTGMTRIKNITGPMMQHILHGAVHLISMSWA